MKQLWVACAILLAIFVGTLANSNYLEHFSESICTELHMAQILAETEKWEDAAMHTQKAFRIWNDNDIYLNIVLRHSDINEIYENFSEVQQYLYSQELVEYMATNAKLITQLELLYHAELLKVENLV